MITGNVMSQANFLVCKQKKTFFLQNSITGLKLTFLIFGRQTKMNLLINERYKKFQYNKRGH